MKKTRILAAVTALLCCFQAGLPMTGNAVVLVGEPIQSASETVSDAFKSELNDLYQQIRDYMQTQKYRQLGCEVHLGDTEKECYIRVYISGYWDLVKQTEQMEDVQAYCVQQGWTEQYHFVFEFPAFGANDPVEDTDDAELFDNVCRKVNERIQNENYDLLSCEVVWNHSADDSYLLVQTAPWGYGDDFAYKTQLNYIKGFCVYNGYSRKYPFSFQFYVPVDGLEDTDHPAMTPASDAYKAELVSVNETIRAYASAQGYSDIACSAIYGEYEETCYILVSAQSDSEESLQAVRNYCEEQRFTCDYAFHFQEFEPEMTATNEPWAEEDLTESASENPENTTDPIESESESPSESDVIPAKYNAGDVDLNGKVNILDVIALNRVILGKDIFNDLQAELADINQDNKIDAADSLCILKYLVGLYDLEAPPASAVNLSQSVKAQAVEGKAADDTFINAQTQFYLNLFQQAAKTDPNENVLVSPYSVMQALAMTANGADGSTKTQMEQTFGGLPLNDLNQYLYTQRSNQPNTDKCKLTTANSIWYRNDADRLHVLPEFLQINADYYDADAFSAPFDDSTVTDINTWCEEKTDGMIPELLDSITSDAVMYLINAVTFDAKWAVPYDSEYNVREGKFIAWDGSVQTAQMLCSGDEYLYLTDDHATGFYKQYQGGKYAFAALLPEEGLSVEDYVAGLTAESLHNTLANPEYVTVYSQMPKFSYDYQIKLNNALCEMGMPEAFTPGADFSRMADTATGALFISEVKHKTYISVTEEGTRAAAVTSVEMNDAAASMEFKIVTLDRPFVYMIVDMENHLPVFMGTVNSVNEG